MWMRSDRGLSKPNRLVIAVAAVGAVGSAISGNPPGAVFLGVIAAGVLVSALVARRAGASDLTRINAVEYRDERDATLARDGLAVTGGVALLLVVVETVVSTFLAPFTPPLVGLTATVVAASQLLVLSCAWGIANWRAVHRR